ncbi:WG repeat-containing protein [bacterium]|nr:WG repeat-containing protein [bacterium]MBP9810270.1 WG repeat-containing protein [bacterium]
MNFSTFRKLILGILIMIVMTASICLGGYWCVFFTSEFPALRQFSDPYGFIDKTGCVVLDLRNHRRNYASGSPKEFLIEKKFSDQRCVIYGDSNSASDCTPSANYVDKAGNFLRTDSCYIFASDFSDGRAAVVDTSYNADRLPRVGISQLPGGPAPSYRWTFIDVHGKTTAGPFCKVKAYAQGLAGVKVDGEPFWKFIDKVGRCVISGKFEQVTSFSEDRAGVLVNGKWGLIDRTGKQVLPPSYSSQIHPFHEGLAAVEVPEASRVSYLNRAGIVQFSLERHSETGSLKNVDVSEGLVVCEKDGKFGFADLSGKPIISPTFDYCWPFSEGRALVCQKFAGKNRFGYVDRLGRLVIPCQYIEAFPFSEGFAVVTTDAHSRYYKYIDLPGGECFGGKTFPYAQSFHEGLAFVGSEYLRFLE